MLLAFNFRKCYAGSELTSSAGAEPGNMSHYQSLTFYRRNSFTLQAFYGTSGEIVEKNIIWAAWWDPIKFDDTMMARETGTECMEIFLGIFWNAQWLRIITNGVRSQNRMPPLPDEAATTHCNSFEPPLLQRKIRTWLQQSGQSRKLPKWFLVAYRQSSCVGTSLRNTKRPTASGRKDVNGTHTHPVSVALLDTDRHGQASWLERSLHCAPPQVS